MLTINESVIHWSEIVLFFECISRDIRVRRWLPLPVTIHSVSFYLHPAINVRERSHVNDTIVLYSWSAADRSQRCGRSDVIWIDCIDFFRTVLHLWYLNILIKNILKWCKLIESFDNKFKRVKTGASFIKISKSIAIKYLNIV